MTHLGSFKTDPSVRSCHDNDTSRQIRDFVDRIVSLKREALFDSKDSRCDDTHCDILVVLSMWKQIRGKKARKRRVRNQPAVLIE